MCACVRVCVCVSLPPHTHANVCTATHCDVQGVQVCCNAYICINVGNTCFIGSLFSHGKKCFLSIRGRILPTVRFVHTSDMICFFAVVLQPTSACDWFVYLTWIINILHSVCRSLDHFWSSFWFSNKQHYLALSLLHSVCRSSVRNCVRTRHLTEIWYGVATISRLLKIIGLFCKRAL